MKISIALCTFNGEKYLAEQLRSLLNQTRLPDEIVVSDDGSKDRTLDILYEFQSKSLVNIRIFEHNENLGVFKNFPFVISECSGDIIFTCDQDDVWNNTKLEKHLSIHTKHPDVDLVYSNADVVLNSPDNYLYPLWETKTILDPINGKANFKSLVIKGQSIAGCCMSFKKEFFSKILPIPEKIFHDDWIATSACLSGKIYGISESLIKYRQHSNNVVGTIRGRKLSYYKSLFTNVLYYVRSDEYIAKRHHIVYEAMQKHDYLKSYLIDRNINEIIELYDSRSNYDTQTFKQSFDKLTHTLLKGNYRLLNGILTYLKDLYNLIIIKLFIKK